jgi:hypothetical protein
MLSETQPNTLILISGDYIFVKLAKETNEHYENLLLVHAVPEMISKDWFSINRNIGVYDLSTFE